VVADWLGARVIVLTRDLRKVISSWTLMAGFEPEDLHLDPWVSERVLSGIPRPRLQTRLERITWTVAILDRSLKAMSQENAWTTITHEALIDDPHGETSALLVSLGLGCSDSVHDFIASHQVHGSGFETRRSSAQLREWETRLTTDQWANVDAILNLFIK